MTPQWAWATHQPLIQSLIDLYDPKYVLEIGVGLYSTPLFISEDIEYLGIEQNKVWIDKVREAIPSVELRYHEVPFDSAFRLWNLTNKQIFDIVSYYSSLRQEIEEKQGVKLLFVDCFTATRLYAINTLWDLFDIVVYHDSHPKVRKVYGYDRLKPTYNQYQLTSKNSWTGAFVKQDIGKTTINNSISKYIKMFNERWNIDSQMKLV